MVSQGKAIPKPVNKTGTAIRCIADACGLWPVKAECEVFDDLVGS
jgi:hypothetical protein